MNICFTTGQTFSKDRLSASLLDTFLGVLLVLCLGGQVIFKSLRPNPMVHLCWLLMPCHLITMIWIWICFNPKKTSTQRGACIFLASLCASCHWGPVGAAAFPDHADHTFPPWEGMAFDLHHALLCLMPFYWAIRYELTPISMQWMLYVFTWATWVNIGPYEVVSLVAGLNLNYMLSPPGPMQKKFPVLFDTVLYRPITIVGLIMLTIICRTSIGFVGWLFKAVGAIFGFGIPEDHWKIDEREKSSSINRASTNGSTNGNTTPRRKSKKD